MLYIKKLLLLIFLIAFAISSHAQLDFDKITTSKKAIEMLDDFSNNMNINMWITQSLKGKVKSCKMTLHEVEKTWFGSIEPTDEMEPIFNEYIEGSLTVFYDKQSRPEKEVASSDGDEVTTEYKYKGSSEKYEQIKISKKIGRNRAIEVIYNIKYNSNYKIESIDINDFSLSTLLYKYSQENELAELWVKFHEIDLLQKTKVYEYENGKLARILLLDNQGKKNESESFLVDVSLTYDNQGRLATLSKNDGMKLNIVYDNRGNIEQEIELGYMNDTTYITTFQYNDLNEEIARTETEYYYATPTVNADSDEANGEYKQYLQRKNITEFENYILTSVTKYEADENGNLQLQPKDVCENKFDKQGNLVEQVTRNSDGEIIERIACEIEYY